MSVRDYLGGRAPRPNPDAPAVGRWRVERRDPDGGPWTLAADAPDEAAALEELRAPLAPWGHGDLLTLRDPAGVARALYVQTRTGPVLTTFDRTSGRTSWFTAWEDRKASASFMVRAATAAGLGATRVVPALALCTAEALALVTPGRSAAERAAHEAALECQARLEEAGPAAAVGPLLTGPLEGAAARAERAVGAAWERPGVSPLHTSAWRSVVDAARCAAMLAQAAGLRAPARAEVEAATAAPLAARAIHAAAQAVAGLGPLGRERSRPGRMDNTEEVLRIWAARVRAAVPLATLLLARAGERPGPDPSWRRPPRA